VLKQRTGIRCSIGSGVEYLKITTKHTLVQVPESRPVEEYHVAVDLFQAKRSFRVKVDTRKG